jgi:phage recombination protein Bet
MNEQNTALQLVAKRLSVSPEELQSIVMKTVMPSNKTITNEQFVSFMAVANEYGLNPLVKEIYAFPTQGGGIQPIVSIDGWLRIINSNPSFNGMTFQDVIDNGALVAVKCSIYKKGIDYPVEVTEYMSECKMNTQPWQKYPARMLRHKAAIQCGRYAFGLSGIIDPDEAERYAQAGVIDMGKAQIIESKEVNEEQAKQLKSLFDKLDAERQSKCLSFFGIDSIEKMPSPQFKEAVTMLGKATKEVPANA